MGDQLADLVFGGIGETVRVDERDLAAGLGCGLGGRGRTVPACGGGAPLGRRLLVAQGHASDPVPRDPGDRRGQPIPAAGADHERDRAPPVVGVGGSHLGPHIVNQLGAADGVRVEQEEPAPGGMDRTYGHRVVLSVSGLLIGLWG